MEGNNVIAMVPIFIGVAIFLGIGTLVLGAANDATSISLGNTAGTVTLQSSGTLVSASQHASDAGSGSFGTSATGTERHYLSVDALSRVKQGGVVEAVNLSIDTDFAGAPLTSFHVDVWREVSTDSWDRVGTTGDILSLIPTAAGVQTVSLPAVNQISGVQEGDYVGFGWTNTVDASNPGIINIVSDGGNDSTYFFDDAPISGTTGVDWTAAGGASANYSPVELLMDAPVIVFIGDSITAGHPEHYTYQENTPANDAPTTSYPNKVGQTLGVSIQNAGIGSDSSSDGVARFATDVVALDPQIVVIGYGTVDINASSTGSTISNIQTMVDDAKAAGITPVIQKVYPRDYDTLGATDAKDTERISLNSQLVTLAASNNISIIDTDSAVGDGNTPLGIDVTYDSGDNIHFNEAGHTQIASATSSALSSIQSAASSWAVLNAQVADTSQSSFGLLMLVLIVLAAVVILGVVRLLG